LFAQGYNVLFTNHYHAFDYMRKLVTVVLVVTGLQGFSQFTYDYLRAADQFFSKGDYFSATQYYEKYLGVGASNIKRKATPAYSPYTIQSRTQKRGGTSVAAVSSRQQAVYNLAESYRMLNYPALAEPQYKKILGSGAAQFPLLQFHYGTTLRSMEMFDDAATAFNTFLNGYTGNDEYTAAAKTELLNLEFIRRQLQKKDLALYTVTKMEGSINAGGANYAPVWLGEQNFLFTSTRSDSTVAVKNKNDNRIYTSTINQALPDKLALGQTAEVQQGAAAISTDGNTLYITRWSSANVKKEAAIFISRKEGNTWGTPVKAEGLNVDGFSTQQPFVLPGRLLFASNRPGGSGGFDLYEAVLDANGQAGTINNLGPLINTAGDEQAPSFHVASNTLVFSSNGRVGMGGFDFYYSKVNNGSYTEPVNFGLPVNSVKDDMYFSSRGSAKNILENVLFSSDRSAACCLELFMLSKQKIPKQVSGKVVRCDDNSPLSSATVKIVDTTVNTVVATLFTGIDGSYTFTLDEFQPLKAMASADGFADNFISFDGSGDDMVNVLRNDNICLIKSFPPPIGVTEALDNIYYEFDEYKLLDVSFATLDKLAANLIAKPNVVIELAGHTDSKGSDEYNQELSQKRAESCVKYLVSKGVNPAQLVAKGYGKSKPLASNINEDGTDNPEGRAKNRRTEFKVLAK
jgi:OmpA-OmpF porin, OOP family